MIRGWIKLWRKTLDNEMIKDQSAWQLFSWLLLKVDKTTGKKKTGRFWVSDELGIKPSTFYKTLKRLEKKYKVVTLQVTGKSTEISIVNWHKYQTGNTSSNTSVTHQGHISNTSVTLYKNKELRIKNREGNPPTPQKSLQTIPRQLSLKTQLGHEIIDFMKSELGLPELDGTPAENMMYAKKLLFKYGTVERVKLLITALSRDTFWSTKITTLRRLDERKMEILKNTTNQKRSGIYVAK